MGHLYRDNPYVIDMHCIAHRLASSQAAAKISYLQKYKRYLIAIYSYFSHSAVRQSRFRELEQLLEEPVLKYHQLYEVRWLSMFEAVRAVRRTLSSLLMFFLKMKAIHFLTP